MPKLVRLIAQRESMIPRHDLPILANGRQNGKVGAGAGRADLGSFRRTKAAREGELALVAYILATKHQNRMLLEGTHGPVGGIIGLNLAKRHAAQRGSKA